MRLAQRSRSVSYSLPAPTGGWNARDALSDMDERDAVTLINMFPTATTVMLRYGHSRHATGLPGQVESVMAYNGPAAQKLFAAAGNSIFNVSAAGAVGAADVTGLSNNRWQHVNISTSGGNFMYAVNGADKPLLYNGSAWIAIDAISTPAITGVTTTTLVHVNLFKNRLWFTQKDTLKVWYLPVNSVGGGASALDFASIARYGGYLVAMGTWTIDAGSGVDDHAVFLTSQGEVIVYAGTDPSDASKWALVGVWDMGSPIGRRCFLKWAGDLLIISEDGVVPLSGALQSSQINPRVALTDKIQQAMSNAATIYGSSFGWDLEFYAKANMLILNVPTGLGTQEQYVMNTITGAWCQFQGWAANCWELFNEQPYFGGDGFVGKAWNTFADNGTNINTTGKQAFNYFRSRGQLKRWTMMQTVLLTNGSPSILMNLNVDFDDSGSTSLLSFSATSNGIWDVSLWDSSVWGTDLTVQQVWQGANGVGYCAAPRLQMASMGINVEWVSTNIVMERGGIL